ncbi:MAG: bifunctional transcriptional activator/DNA repair enzyme AdaA [Planifilum fulgidum]|jgi:AraC family transcriptional regulator, regulatory protein of adaptative response / methylphosphotriester-DNA alkyltransferase methyltransferase
MKIQREALWKAVVRCDGRYDGFFYYAVKTTGIFCRPSCKSKTPKRENVEFFFSREEALRKGYKPCKRCRPDLRTSTYDPNRELIEEVKIILENEYDKPWTLQRLSERIGISSYYLQRLFKKETGISPKQYLNRIRVQQAKRLLMDEEQNVTEICYTVGFSDLSRFYQVFREATGSSPLAFKHGNKNDGSIQRSE